jgi:hypothetical protein
MKKSPLAACPACDRHVRVDEPTCPFCQVGLPPSFRERTAPPPPAARLSRAALYALRVGALSATTVACGGALGTGGSEKDSGSSNAAPINDAAYGGPPPDASGQDDAPTTGIAAYGGFFASDSGVLDAPTGFDAAYGGVFVPDGNFAPPYGISPIEPPDAAPTDASSHPDAIHGPPPPPYGGPPPFN